MTSVPTTQPAAYPPARIGPYLVYAQGSNRSFMLSGCNDYCNVIFYDLYSFDLATNQWKYRTDNSPWFPSDVVYDSKADRLIAYDDSGKATYAYDAQANRWVDLKATHMPSVRWMGYMAYDSESDKIIFFGGLNPADNTKYDETWAFDYPTAAWVKMNPAVHPSATYAFPLVYDTESDRVILWSGDGVEKVVWAYDYNRDQWEKLPYTDGPAPMASSVGRVPLAYAPDLDKIFLYNGTEFYTYDYNHNRWEKPAGDLKPGARNSHVLAYDTSAKRLVLFGGTPKSDAWDLVTNDTWLYDPQTGEWKQVGP
jgi:hypothetical protein